MSDFIFPIILLIVVGVLGWGIWKLRDRFEIIREFVSFLRERKLWWIIPVLIVFILAGLLVVITAGSPIGAFIYTLF